ncbi:hypothetical protein ICL16_10600 [Iningainema sp. BLCCT55]|uniref:Uncharacterized protein n=1 Tax=Iningainema tapete BLCC-T55 TaxID=2748662 RepID=A0A8J6XRW2_9CYAN|nr:hypothetical protein [Iningainema tapete BLCC-T55]
MVIASLCVNRCVQLIEVGSESPTKTSAQQKLGVYKEAIAIALFQLPIQQSLQTRQLPIQKHR